MTKAKWNDNSEKPRQWRALSDMKAARAADHATTSEGTMMAQASASAVTTPKNQTFFSSTPTDREQMAKIKQLLMDEYIQTFQHQYRNLFDNYMASQYDSYLERTLGGTQTENNSASPTETKTENLSVFKDVTTTPTGPLKPST